MIRTAFHGLCMAVADSVPGVSGGTIAFILGFYDRFIEALHSLAGGDRAAKKGALHYLLRLGVGWVIGMGACVLLLSGLFAANIYFMSSVFLGLTAASIPFVAAAERDSLRENPRNVLLTLLGAALVAALSLLRAGAGTFGSIDFLHLSVIHYAYLFFAGMAAISAMVLPGISGSTVLLIAGVYLPSIEAAKELLHFNLAVLPGLCALGLGIVCGVGVSIHSIRSALRTHRSGMMYLILGLMFGSLFAIVMGPTTLADSMPALGFSNFRFCGFVIGVLVLLGLMLLERRESTKGSAQQASADEFFFAV